jgi:magnesium transporter
MNMKQRKQSKRGKPPGSLVHVGTRYLQKPEVEIISYNTDEYERSQIDDFRRIPMIENRVDWLNISGVHDPDLIGAVGTQFSIHPLLSEDIMNTYQRPKIEFSKDHMLIILKMADLDEHGLPVYEQVSLIVGRGYLISFQEKPGDVLEEVRKRIAFHSGYIRDKGADYLCYAIVDAIIDKYYEIMESISDRVEQTEETIASQFSETLSGQIHALRKDVIYLKKAVWPLREVIGSMLRDGKDYISQDAMPFFRDTYDHVIQIVDGVETYRDLISGLSDSYMNSVSNRMNSIMKVLTLISTIFIPMTFIAGIYGMNFAYMPELSLRWGYFAAWGVMITIAVIMIIFFRRKKWL